MSELKMHHINEVMDMHNLTRGKMGFSIVYYADDVDKVIEEKDEKIDELEERVDELQKATDSAWSKVNAMYDELRHHKYKRCLAMAMWCDTKADWYYSLGEPFIDCVQFYIRWRDKWLELAEKFKEAK